MSVFPKKIFLRLQDALAEWYHHLKATEYTFLVILAVIIGVLAGLGAVGFRFLIRFIQLIAYREWDYSLELIRGMEWYLVVLIPALGGLFVGIIVYFFAREAKGHGVPEVMEAVALRSGRIRPRVVIAKSFASAISIGTGGSVGREGPIVQIGSAIGSTVGQILRVSPQMLRTFVGCGAAAGIAATFNAPVAGALFAVEVILSDFGVSRFSPIVISSVIATVISRHFLGNFPAFEVPAYDFVHPVELIFYTVMGLLAGLVSILFIRVLYFSEDRFDDLRIPEYIKPVLGGLVIGSIGLQYPEIFGVGYEAINEALHGSQLWSWLLILVFVKVIATSITIGSGGSGGIFAPSLFLGAMLGGFIGTNVHTLFPGMSASSGAYALVGMGAIVAGTTRAPITAIVIIFELTGNYKIILPLMIACIISTLISSKLFTDSIYTMKLVRRGVNIFKRQELNVLKSLKVRDVMTQRAEIIPESSPLGNLLERSIDSQHLCMFTTDRDDKLSGVIPMHDLRQILFDREFLDNLIIAQDIADAKIVPVTPDDNLDSAMKYFGQKGIDELPVVQSSSSRKIIGSLMKNQVIEAYNREIFKRDMLDQLAGQLSDLERAEEFNLAGGYSLTEMQAPRAFIGKSIRELNIRARYDVQIILIRKYAVSGDEESEPIQFAPDPDYVIQETDHFYCVGNKRKIDAMRYL